MLSCGILFRTTVIKVKNIHISLQEIFLIVSYFLSFPDHMYAISH